jgi:hypothetical protein
MIHFVTWKWGQPGFKTTYTAQHVNGFDPVRSPEESLKAGFFGSDQSYISSQLVYGQDTGGWTSSDGVLSYPREVRANRRLPAHSRVVFFHGKRKPWDTHTRLESRWIDKYWRL